MSFQQLNDIIRSRNELKTIEDTRLKDDKLVKHTTNNYSNRFRLLKTTLLVFAWISLGLNQEMLKTTLEDLRILLSTNYYYISLAFITRSIGYLLTTFFIGALMDSCLKYSDLFMAFAQCVMVASESFQYRPVLTKRFFQLLFLF
jgi:hypothetical protein